MKNYYIRILLRLAEIYLRPHEITIRLMWSPICFQTDHIKRYIIEIINGIFYRFVVKPIVQKLSKVYNPKETSGRSGTHHWAEMFNFRRMISSRCWLPRSSGDNSIAIIDHHFEVTILVLKHKARVVQKLGLCKRNSFMK